MTLDRFKSGNEKLDEVLHGGFLPNTINVIMGAPGTGKTILAEQLIFANATPATPALYLTTLSEPLEKFIQHGERYGFFNSARVGESVFYEDLGAIVRQRGMKDLAEVVAEMLAERRPRSIVIDSFKALSELIDTAHERRTILFDLASVLGAYNCTVFLIGEYSGEMMTDLPEFAIADSIISLMKKSTGVRQQRFLRVEKLRGSGAIPGMHAFNITANGINLFPRLLTPKVSPDYEAEFERVQTGVHGLDEMIERGFWRGSTTLIAGPSGSGKTILGLHFLREGIINEEPSVLVGFQENPTQLARAVRSFDWDSDAFLNSSHFEFMYRSPVELEIDGVAAELFDRVRKGQVKRVVIDAIGDLKKASIQSERFSDYLYSLTQWFATKNVTCLLLYEVHNLFEITQVSNEEVSNMSDNIVLLRFNDESNLSRTVRIIKTRGSGHDNQEHVLEIARGGAVIQKG